jgi:hypothetical protein
MGAKQMDAIASMLPSPRIKSTASDAQKDQQSVLNFASN